MALMPAATTRSTTCCADAAGTAMTAMLMPSRRASFFRSWMSWIGTPPRDCCPTLSLSVVEQRRDLEAFLAEARVVGEREAEVAGADDGDAQLAIEPEDLAQVALQIADVVADAAHAELAEVGEVLADLRGVQVELFGERLGRNRLDAGRLELVQAAQVDREAVGGELGDLIERSVSPSDARPAALFRRFTSRAPIVTKTAVLISARHGYCRSALAPRPTVRARDFSRTSRARSRPPSSRSRPSSSARCSACCSARRRSTSVCAPA